MKVVSTVEGLQTITEYAYDVNGNRTSMSTNGQMTEFINDTLSDLTMVLAEISSEKTVVYTYGNDIISMSVDVQYDDSTGLYNMRARYMDPSTGRFLIMDTYQGSIWEPTSLHKYTYTSGNPVMYQDMSGYSEATISNSGVAMVVNSIIATVVFDHMVLGMYSRIVESINAVPDELTSEFNDLILECNKDYDNIISNFSIFDIVSVQAINIINDSVIQSGEIKDYIKWFGKNYDFGCDDDDESDFKHEKNNKKYKKKTNESRDIKRYKNNKMADKQAQKHGFENAHDFKQCHVDDISRYDMAYNIKTGRIYLLDKLTGILKETIYFHIP